MITMTKLGTRLALASALVLPALAAAPVSARAQAADPHWLPWIGCWQTVASGDMIGTPSASVCVVPTSSPSAVEILTVADGMITDRDRVDAAGVARPSSEEGCEGTELVQWSNDGRRLYRTTEQRCAGNIQRSVSGLLAILPSGEWMNAQGITVGGNTGTRVLRYRPLEDLSAFPVEVTRSLQGQRLAIQAARSNAAAAPSTSDIVDASRHLEHDVVGAWLMERGQGFAVNANKLVELADAGVPEQVIDIMVALSYPDRFAINLDGGATELRPDDENGRYGRGLDPRVRSPWGYDPYYGYGYPPYMYRLGYRNGWGWGGYNNGYYGGYYGRPVVIVRGSDEEGASSGRGRAVKDQGYTRSGSSRGTGSSSRPTRARAPESGGSSSSGSARSSGGSSSGSGSSGSSTGRTAKPRGSG